MNDIPFVFDPMTTKLCTDMCEDDIFTVVKVNEHWIDETMGTHVPTGRSASARQQKQRGREMKISLVSQLLWQNHFTEVCSRMLTTISPKELMIRVTKQRETPIPSTAAKLAVWTAGHTTGKPRRGSTIHHLRYMIYSEEHENKMRKMMGCSHQELTEDRDEGDGSQHRRR
jgi:hypothetical protein